MGDFNKALNVLIDGQDKGALVDKESDEALDRKMFTFTSTDRIVLRQFECGSQPCVLLSKFFQLNESTCHETLFVIVARLAQMKESSFLMFGDISHTDLPDLTRRTKTVTVVASNVSTNPESGQDEQEMDECIELFRSLYVEDMSRRCGLTEENGDPVYKVPVMIGLVCLLNPMYGGMYQQDQLFACLCDLDLLTNTFVSTCTVTFQVKRIY
jgi:hypothetical protein